MAAVVVAVSLAVPSPAKEVLVGIASSFAFATTALLLQTFHRHVIDTARRDFFGDELLDAGPTFAYPDFELAPEVKDLLQGHNSQLLYAKPVRHFAQTVHRVDLPRAAASNDMEALVHLASLFDASTARPMSIRTDYDVVRHCDCSFLSVGLSSNDCTHLYLTTADVPLFAIVDDDAGSEFIRLYDGSEFRSTPERQVGVILRYAPEPHDVPSRRWFLVAGLGPLGTIGAAWFITHCWRRLHSDAGPRDFVAVISIPSATERRVRFEALLQEPT